MKGIVLAGGTGINIGVLGTLNITIFSLKILSLLLVFLDTKYTSNSLNIILPVGISFYTFQTLSYTIDVYRRKFKTYLQILLLLRLL